MATHHSWRGTIALLTVGLCVSVGALTWFGFRAIRQWQDSSALLMRQRSDAAADRLVTAVMRDMQAVQRRVLWSADWSDPKQSLYDVGDLAATAFAQYPYPDSFFIARDSEDVDAVTFFTRSDRLPAWVPAGTTSNRFPVATVTQPQMAALVMGAIDDDIANGRRFAVVEIPAAGTVYQIVARLRYSGAVGDRFEGMFGFMVDMNWVRRHYFQELIYQVSRADSAPGGLEFSVLDEQKHRIASTQADAWDVSGSRREFTLMFFDPLLVAAGLPKSMRAGHWTAEAIAVPDPTLPAAIRGADRTVLVAALAAGVLGLGLVTTARAAKEIDKVSALRADFVATVTHELKTPIAAIRAVGDTLAAGRIASAEGQREYAQLVVQEAKTLTRLVDNLLALSRITDVTEVYWFEPLALRPLVERTLKEFEPQLRAGAFETAIDLPAGLPPLRGDRTALSLMLENLVDNAIRYSPGVRSLTIGAHADGDRIVLAVADRGCGIPADQLDHVTQKFFRGTPSASKGSGLGLAIVKRIVGDHGGDLTIASAVGVGTTITISLPVARNA